MGSAAAARGAAARAAATEAVTEAVGLEEAAGAVAAEVAARVVAMEAVHGAKGVGLVRPLHTCEPLCERSSGMSFVCAVKRAGGCIVWMKAGLVAQVVAAVGRRTGMAGPNLAWC